MWVITPVLPLPSVGPWIDYIMSLSIRFFCWKMRIMLIVLQGVQPYKWAQCMHMVCISRILVASSWCHCYCSLALQAERTLSNYYIKTWANLEQTVETWQWTYWESKVFLSGKYFNRWCQHIAMLMSTSHYLPIKNKKLHFFLQKKGGGHERAHSSAGSWCHDPLPASVSPGSLTHIPDVLMEVPRCKLGTFLCASASETTAFWKKGYFHAFII